LNTCALCLDVHHFLDEPTGAVLVVELEEGERQLGDDVDVALLRGKIELLRTDYGLFARGEVVTQIESLCARCLDPFPSDLTVHLADQFARNPQTMTEDENPVFPILGRGRIDLAPPLREHILLNLPLHPLCRPDCRGLCSQCGANLNEAQCDCSQEEGDPRLAALRALLEK
jgi:uncharacterized protein